MLSGITLFTYYITSELHFPTGQDMERDELSSPVFCLIALISWKVSKYLSSYGKTQNVSRLIKGPSSKTQSHLLFAADTTMTMVN